MAQFTKAELDELIELTEKANETLRNVIMEDSRCIDNLLAGIQQSQQDILTNMKRLDELKAQREAMSK